jgi:hypothetical protein
LKRPQFIFTMLLKSRNNASQEAPFATLRLWQDPIFVWSGWAEAIY